MLLLIEVSTFSVDVDGYWSPIGMDIARLLRRSDSYEAS
jgi:hypothetical protein